MMMRVTPTKTIAPEIPNPIVVFQYMTDPVDPNHQDIVPQEAEDGSWADRIEKEYEQKNVQSLVRDLDGVINKLNTSFQEELKQEIEAKGFFLE